MSANDLFEKITLQIIAAVEAGAEAYRMPWHRWGQSLAQPVNAVSGRTYRGINRLLLWAAAENAGYPSGRWATYRQWNELGAQVRTGERSTGILFWKQITNITGEDAEQEISLATRTHPMARVYCVFNEQQVEGARPSVQHQPLTQNERIEAAEAFVAATGASIVHDGDQAYFDVLQDQIRLPRFEQFRSAECYYSVLSHECIHWSGAQPRLDRNLSGRFGSDAYAMEELVAELGSAFICGHLGIGVEPRVEHAAYISSWLRILRGDSRAILIAASKAQNAADYLISLSSPELASPENPVPHRADATPASRAC